MEGRSPRNILLITTDQERYFASDPAPLPARERLRSLGTTFDHFYGASVACSPARSVVFTGQHTPVTGVIDNLGMPGQADLPIDLDTIGDRLRSLGYYTALKGKWHLSLGAFPNRGAESLVDVLEPYGFADYSLRGDDLGVAYEGFECDDLIAAEATQWLKTEGRRLQAEGRPWFLAVNFVNPHDVMFATWDQEFRATDKGALGGPPFRGAPPSERYRDSWDLPLDASRSDALTAPDRPGAHLEFFGSMSVFMGDAPVANDEELRLFRDYYVNCIRDVDAAMVQLLDGVEQLGLLKTTAIVFSSDHGELAGAHGLFGKGPCSYDENLRLPLIVVDPDVPGGQRRDAIASQVDLVPTMLGLAGAPADHGSRAGLPGRDLTPLLSGDAASRAVGAMRHAALFAYSGLGFLDASWMKGIVKSLLGGGPPPVVARDFTKRGLMRTIITDRFKFSRYFAPGEHHAPGSFDELRERNTLELFDLESDPEERVSLAFEPTPESCELIEQLNVELQALVGAEIGDDDGKLLPAVPGAPWSS